MISYINIAKTKLGISEKVRKHQILIFKLIKMEIDSSKWCDQLR